MPDIDLNLFLNNKQFTDALKGATDELSKFLAQNKVTNEQIVGMQQELIVSTEAQKKKQIELNETVNKIGYKEYKKQMDEAHEAILQQEIALEKLNKVQKTVNNTTEDSSNTIEATNETVKRSGGAWKGLLSILSRVTVILAIVRGALKFLSDIVKTNQSSMNKLKVVVAQVGAVYKTLTRFISENNRSLREFFAESKKAVQAAKELKEMQFALIAIQNQNLLLITDLESAMIGYEKAMNDETKTVQERTAAANEYYAAEWQILMLKENESQQIYDIAIGNLMRETKLTKEQVLELVKLGSSVDKNNKLYKEWSRVSTESVTAFVQAEAAYRKAGDQLTLFEQQKSDTIKKILQDYSDAIKKDQEDANRQALQRQKEFQNASEELAERYAKALVEIRTGKDKIEAERQFQLSELAITKKYLEERGKLTEDQLRQIEMIKRQINNESDLQLIEFEVEQLAIKQKSADDQVKIEQDKRDKIKALNQETQEIALGLLKDSSAAQIKLRIQFAKDELAAIRTKIMSGQGNEADGAEATRLATGLAVLEKELKDFEAKGEEFSIWKMLGLGDNPEAQDAIKQGIKATTYALDEIFDARVEDAQRTRELLDTQISETQRALEAEVELAKLGYANNVDAKRKELAALKTEREKALKEEEKAIKAQRLLDTISQTSSLITASADIFKSLAKLGPIGIAVAIGTIATMFGAFIAAKTKAAGTTKLAKGGVGTVEGRSHAEGGEPFLENVEVERGEMWGVLSRKATKKYGKAFNQVVTSFNKDQLPVRTEAGDTSILVDVNQTNERLDKVEYQLIKMNKHFSRSRDVTETKDARIERIGRKTRIIRKNV